MSERDRNRLCPGSDSSKSTLTRREFVVTSTAAGVAAAAGLGFGSPPDFGNPDLAIATGPDVVRNTRSVIEAMGGIDAFVKPGQVVNVLPNAQGSHPGTSTDPELVRTVVDLCRQAGASDVRWLTWISGKYWHRSNIASLSGASGATMVKVDSDDPDQWRKLDVPKGIALKTVRVFKPLWECDVFISMPIFKDHIGSRFTGSLKNYMGASHPTDNRAFHPTFEGEDLLHMEQCIADLNTVVRTPDLIVADAMTILTSKGPFGPGDIASPRQVVAGIDRVALDAYGATLLGLDGQEVTMIQKAADHGLGTIDLASVKIVKIGTA
jgi:uncharacterized protein (DUF362 family)